MIAVRAADIAFAGVDPQAIDIEQSYMLARLLQVVPDSKRKLGGLRDVLDVLVVAIAGGLRDDNYTCASVTTTPGRLE
jgi:hypothetical protein